jgi:DnaA family protein
MQHMQITQLPLGLKLRDDAIFDNFFIGSNEQIVETLKAFISRQSEQFVYCYGEPGVGRTHLLQACCHAASEQNDPIFYLPLSSYKELSPRIFEDMEHQRYVCIDDVDAIVGDRAWEEALFHFYNRARDNRVSLLISARHAPQQLHSLLPDLQSRLMWGLVLEIKALTDEEKIDALKMRAALRGFSLSDEVGNYLIRHYPRHMHDLFAVLETLDHASLAAKRRLTIPFVRSVMRNSASYASMPQSNDAKR